MLSGFLTGYLFVGVSQLDRSTGSVNSFLQTYWAHGFPPHNPLNLIGWLLMIHTSRMLAYPIGGDHGLCLPQLVLFLIGLVWLWRHHNRSLVLLCVGPFALGLVAAVLRRYPYGGCCRLSQHVAPIICLAVGTGAAALIGRLRTVAQQQRALHLAGGLFVVVGVTCLLIDVLHPYRGDCDLWSRGIIRHVVSQCGPDDQIVVLNDEEQVDVVFRWELARFKQRGGPLSWSARVNEDKLRSTTGQVWVLKMAGSPRGFDVIGPHLEQSHRTWILTNQVPYTIIPEKKRDPVLRCDAARWVSPGTPGLPADLTAVSCWP
jgi:hypothetical protein